MSTTFTLEASPTFPVGTSLGVYRYFDQAAQNAQPTGDQVTTATVAADGTARFTGLANDASYVAAANLSTEPAFPDWRWKRFRTHALRDVPIWGAVSATGGWWGDTFTATKTATGTYLVTYDVPFDADVSVTVTPLQSASARIATLNTSAVNRFSVTIYTDAGVAVDTLFHFHAYPIT